MKKGDSSGSFDPRYYTLDSLSESSLFVVRHNLEQFLEDYDITEYPVDCFALVKTIQQANRIHLDVEVEEKLSKAFDASAKYFQEVDSYLIIMKPVPRDWQRRSSWRRCNFSMAHELGHIFCGHLFISWDMKSEEIRHKEDLEADEFAARLLMPEHLILSSHFSSCEELSKKFLVSDQACFKRLNNLKRLDLIRLSAREAHEVCSRCGAPRLDGAAFCFTCGDYNRYEFIFRKDPPAVPPAVQYHGTHFTSCPFCGNAHIPDDALYCIQCGKPVTNPCLPNRLRDQTTSSGLARLDLQSRHLCSPGVLYCPDCGSRTLFGVSGVDDRLGPDAGASAACDESVSDSKPADKSDPCRMNRDRRLAKCLYCGRSRHDADARFCTMCGKPVVNACTGCSHRNIAIAKYCEKCGQMTAFMAAGLLPVSGEYHLPPALPEGEYTRAKRFEDKRRQERVDRDRRLKELWKQYE